MVPGGMEGVSHSISIYHGEGALLYRGGDHGVGARMAWSHRAGEQRRG